MKEWILTIALLCSIDQIRTAHCQTACRYIGFDNAYYNDNKCYCVEVKDYAELVGKEITPLPKKASKPSSSW